MIDRRDPAPEFGELGDHPRHRGLIRQHDLEPVTQRCGRFITDQIGNLPTNVSIGLPVQNDAVCHDASLREGSTPERVGRPHPIQVGLAIATTGILVVHGP